MQKFVIYYTLEIDFTTNSEHLNKTSTMLQIMRSNA